MWRLQGTFSAVGFLCTGITSKMTSFLFLESTIGIKRALLPPVTAIRLMPANGSSSINNSNIYKIISSSKAISSSNSTVTLIIDMTSSSSISSSISNKNIRSREIKLREDNDLKEQTKPTKITETAASTERREQKEMKAVAV